MSDFLDEEEEEEVEPPKRRGRPRPPDVFTFDRDNFTASYRAVRGGKHGGAQGVTEADTLGEVVLCWCGEPYDHNWPGKASGKKHPREESSVPRDTAVHNAAEAEAISRSDLRGYHRSIQDFILEEVQVNGLKYRIAKNSVLLYPPDDSPPVPVFARNTDAQIRSLAGWHNRHVKPILDAEAKAKEPVDEKALAKLAESLNDPVEHPRQEVQSTEEPIYVHVETPVEPREEPEVAAQTEEQTEQWVDPLAFEVDYTAPPSRYGAPRGYRWHTNNQGENIAGIAVHPEGERYICVFCLKTDHPWEGERPIQVGGHRRWRHSKDSSQLAERMRSPEAREKSKATKEKKKHVLTEVQKAINDLCAATGYYPQGGGVSQKEHDAVVRELADAKARIALMQEAFRGL